MWTLYLSNLTHSSFNCTTKYAWSGKWVEWSVVWKLYIGVKFKLLLAFLNHHWPGEFVKWWVHALTFVLIMIFFKNNKRALKVRILQNVLSNFRTIIILSKPISAKAVLPSNFKSLRKTFAKSSLFGSLTLFIQMSAFIRFHTIFCSSIDVAWCMHLFKWVHFRLNHCCNPLIIKCFIHSLIQSLTLIALGE